MMTGEVVTMNQLFWNSGTGKVNDESGEAWSFLLVYSSFCMTYILFFDKYMTYIQCVNMKATVSTRSADFKYLVIPVYGFDWIFLHTCSQQPAGIS